MNNLHLFRTDLYVYIVDAIYKRKIFINHQVSINKQSP